MRCCPPAAVAAGESTKSSSLRPPPLDALLGLVGESYCGVEGGLVPSDPAVAAPPTSLVYPAANPGARPAAHCAAPLMRPWLCLLKKFRFATGMSHTTQKRKRFPDDLHWEWLHASIIPCCGAGGMAR